MDKRTDRYKEQDGIVETPKTRVNKNKVLYEEVNSKIGFEEIPTYISQDEINLSALDMDNLNREEYQKVKDYKDLLVDSEKGNEKPKEEKPKKNYDINKVLEEAKKNRKQDELEGKRNLKEEDYNVLNNLNKKYLHQKGFSKEDNDELKELIDTITSKTLVDDVKDDEEKELLSELLATTIDIKLENELSKTQIQEMVDEEKEFTDTNSFYSKSLELSKDDMEEEKEEKEEIKVQTSEEDSDDEMEEGHNVAKIIFISILLAIVVLVLVYFILQSMGITFN